MKRLYNKALFTEDWTAFPTGPLKRDRSAKGEYMTMIVPENIHGWYTNANGRGAPSKDRDTSPFTIKKIRGKPCLELPHKTYEFSHVMTTGPQIWRDMELTARVTPKDVLPCGIVVRYETNHDFYSLIIESNTLKLIRMFEGHITVLDSALLKPFKDPLTMKLRAEGTALTASAGGVKLAATDGCILEGGIGLFANGACRFGKAAAKTYEAEAKRIARAEKARSVFVSKKRRQHSPMELIAAVDVKGHAVGRQLRFADLNNDGKAELLFGVPTVYKAKKWSYNELSRLSALTLDGDVLWERGSIKPDADRITADLPFQAADRGNGMEIVCSFRKYLEILDPMTGKTRRKMELPLAQKMDDYWDEINMYWGDGHGDDKKYLMPDSINFGNFTGRHRYGDIFMKDRYHNGYAVNGKSLKVMWHHACNTGHFPYICDLNGDGLDDIVMGYSRMSNRGKLMARLYLGDHPDGCFHYVDSDGFAHNLHPCGDAGFVDEYEDWRIAELHLGHVQHISLGNFVPDRPDLERISVTYHGNEGVITMLDMNNRILRKAERYGAGSICQPVNWAGDGSELIAFSPRHKDGGLWDGDFDLVVPFPDTDRPGQYMEVHDLMHLGYDQIVVWDEERLHVYAPTNPPKRTRGKRFAPKRPGPCLSNYQVNYSIPQWI